MTAPRQPPNHKHLPGWFSWGAIAAFLALVLAAAIFGFDPHEVLTRIIMSALLLVVAAPVILLLIGFVCHLINNALDMLGPVALLIPLLFVFVTLLALAQWLLHVLR